MRLPHQLKLVRNDKNSIMQNSGMVKEDIFLKIMNKKL